MLAKKELDQLRADVTFSTQLAGKHFKFLSTWGLFSPRGIDEGSALLLEYVTPSPNDDCLDLGCGYGPLGLALAYQAPQGQTLMVDKDFVAVDYANRNAALNQLANAEAILSNGFSHIPADRQFDVIVSNVPAKVGNEMLTLMLHDAYKHLKPEGKLYLVTINGLRQYIKRMLNEVFGNYDKLKQSAHYTVALANR